MVTDLIRDEVTQTATTQVICITDTVESVRTLLKTQRPNNEITTKLIPTHVWVVNFSLKNTNPPMIKKAMEVFNRKVTIAVLTPNCKQR